MRRRHFSIVEHRSIYHEPKNLLPAFDLSEIIHGKRFPLAIIDPFQGVGVKHNYKREFWASTGQALSTIQLKRLSDQSALVMDRIPTISTVQLAQELNSIFLKALCIEDQRVIASFIYDYNPKLIQHLIDAIAEGQNLEYLLIRLLYNLSYSLEARFTITALGGMDIVMGLLRIASPETAMYSLELLENLTDSFTPQMRSRMAVRSNVRSLVSVVRRPVEVVLFLLRPLLVLLERIAYHGPAQQIIYRMSDTFTKSLARLHDTLEHSTVSREHRMTIFRLRKHIQFIEKRHETRKYKPWMIEA